MTMPDSPAEESSEPAGDPDEQQSSGGFLYGYGYSYGVPLKSINDHPERPKPPATHHAQEKMQPSRPHHHDSTPEIADSVKRAQSINPRTGGY